MRQITGINLVASVILAGQIQALVMSGCASQSAEAKLQRDLQASSKTCEAYFDKIHLSEDDRAFDLGGCLDAQMSERGYKGL